MPTERIGDIVETQGYYREFKPGEGPDHLPCYDPDHNPPQPPQPGRYRHTCPACGKEVEFVVRPSMRA